jgi:adenosine/AMP kinase
LLLRWWYIRAGTPAIRAKPDLLPTAVNVLKAVVSCPTVCRVFCATANPTAVIVGRDDRERRGVLGVLDGFCPRGVENADDQKTRKDLLKNIGYKR